MTLIEAGSSNGELFIITKKDYPKSFYFTFDLRYWPSYEGNDQPSGDYIFRPQDKVYDSLKYTTLKSIEYS